VTEIERGEVMTTLHYPVDTSAGKIEKILHDMFDGSTPVVAVQIFDDPTSRFSAILDADIGPWVLGNADEVYTWLRENGHQDYDTQYKLASDGG
jgi:hypothetical protein